MASCYNWVLPMSQITQYSVDIQYVGEPSAVNEDMVNLEMTDLENGTFLFNFCLEVSPIFRDITTGDTVAPGFTVTEGGTCTTDGDCVYDPDPDPDEYNLTVSSDNDTQGTTYNLTENLGVSSPYDEGYTVILIATPLPGFQFDRWESNLVEIPGAATLIFEMPSEDVSLVAFFTASEVDPPTPEEDEETDIPTPVVTAEYLPSIYDHCSKFLLVKDLPYNLPAGSELNESLFDELDWTEIAEPDAWDAVKFKVERNEDYGFTQVASLDAIGFSCTSGRSFIDETFKQDGEDANVKLIFAVKPYGYEEYVIQLINDINFTEYGREKDTTEVNLEKSEFNTIFDTRVDVPYIYPREIPVFMYSKALPEVTQYTRKPARLYEDLGSKPSNYNDILAGWGLFNSDTQLKQIGGSYTYPEQMTYVRPSEESKYVMKPKLPGKYKVNIQVAATAIDLTAKTLGDIADPFPTPGSYGSGEIRLKLYVEVRDSVNGGVKFSEILDPTDLEHNLSIKYYDFSGEESSLGDVTSQIFESEYNFELTTNDELYVYFRVNKAPGGGTNSWNDGNVFLKVSDVWLKTVGGSPSEPVYEEFKPFDLESPVIEVFGLTLQKASVAYQGCLFEAINSILKQSLVKSRDVLVSDVLSDGGALRDLTIGNGFSIRNAAVLGEGTDSRASFNELYHGARALLNLGRNIEVNSDGKEVVRIEAMDYFFADKEILTFTEESDILSFREGADLDYTFNEVEVGYKNFSKERETDKGETLQDTHGKLHFLTPVKKVKNKLSVISDFIGSAFEIERTRRKQYDPESENSNEKNDDSVYMVQLLVGSGAVSSVTGFRDFFSIPNFVDFDIDGSGYRFLNRSDIPVIPGDVVTIFYNNISQGTREVKEVLSSPQGLDDTLYDTIVTFTQAPPALPPLNPQVQLVMVLPEARYMPESIEPFDQVNNLSSPETHFNLRWTPKRMMKNWGKVINAGLSYKDGDEDITFQEGEGNTELETELKITDPFPLGDIQRNLIKEGESITLSQLWGRNTHFISQFVNFKILMGFDVYNYILRSHQGNSSDDNNYGFIQIPDFQGNLLRGYLVNLEYDPYRKEADFRLRIWKRIPILEADIIQPIYSSGNKAFVDENGNYIQYED